ncbi:protein translocase subunit secB [Mariprofundus aestuarium]|uniref:Protein translocase subunit secB n=1 Tax=Mariprofundus aestuarium TaxID=1921086 RepID=A0A2K8KXH5_MARES|nr:protein-export chaperone SecB [Mariprofundus aestuarium]ATX79645.1 protein translocase subunit secB [Mariprofundus aestuarium]
MSDLENSATEKNMPAFSVQKIYVKDISFENPNAPGVFAAPTDQPKIEMNLSTLNRQVNADHWEVSIKISSVARDSESDKVLFEVEVEHAGLFYLKNIPEEHMATLIGVDCPTIIFPYTRQLISQLTVDGGFMPLLLEPVNFAAAFQNSQQQQAEEQPVIN